MAVLAATSRPDLVDAALLRPGRLDRLLHCGLPTAAQRTAILRAVGRHLPLAANIDLSAIAQCTQGWTGADLAALLAEAQLVAAHRHLAADRSSQVLRPQHQSPIPQ